MPARCPAAVHIGVRMCSRCYFLAGHSGPHIARGAARYPAQRIQWVDGDRRQFLSERTDDYAWDQTREEIEMAWPPVTT